MTNALLTSVATASDIERQSITCIAGNAKSGASIEDMIRAASDTVQAPSESGAAPTDGSPTGGVQIERQDIEHVRGQAKSGKSLYA